MDIPFNESYVQDVLNPQPPNYPRYAGPDQIPSHVPSELVLNCGFMTSPEFLADPYHFMASLHQNYPPIFYNMTPNSNSWMLTKYDDIMFALRSPEIFTNRDATPFPRDPNDYFFFIPQEIDPPDHRHYRKIAEPLFGVNGIKSLKEAIHDRAATLIERLVEQGECQFTTAFGRPFPVSVFLDIMGLPQDMRDTFVEWGDTMIHSQNRQEVADAFGKAVAYLHGAIKEKKSNPDEGMISVIAHAEIEGRPLTDKEIFGFVCFLWIGGLDTVYAMLNNIWAWFAKNPDRVQEIIDRPDDVEHILHELLRRFSVTFSARVVIQDIELRGVQMKKGDRIFTCLPAGNFDPEVFPNPLEVDFDRPRKPNLAFTAGIHSCLGAHLAKMELTAAIQEWLRRIPQFSLKPGTAVTYKPGGVIGPTSVPLIWE
jgi:cytochrome P450